MTLAAQVLTLARMVGNMDGGMLVLVFALFNLAAASLPAALAALGETGTWCDGGGGGLMGLV